MQYFSGLVPDEQQVLHPKPYPYVYRPALPRRRHSIRTGLLACLLLVLAFVLLLWGGGLVHPGFSTMNAGNTGHSLEEAPIAMAASMIGYSQVEMMQLLWENGINMTGAEQTLKEIAEENGRKSSDLLAILNSEGVAEG